MSRIKWSQTKQKLLKQWQEEGVNLLELDKVKDGEISVNAIKNAGHRYFGFGSHKDKATGAITLTSKVSHTKPNGTRSRRNTEGSQTVAEVSKEPSTPTSEALNQWHFDMLLSMCVKDKKQNKLADIIASLRVVGNAELADNLEYCTS